MASEPLPPESGQLLIYQDGATRLQVRLEGHTVWLPQRLIAELYQVSVKTVNEHLSNIYDDGELERGATIRKFRKFRIVQREGDRNVTRTIEHYNLDAILAVGYRVRSARGTAFRQWATARLTELLVKGFTLDDERLKEGRTLGADYFDELLERIRDIRAQAFGQARPKIRPQEERERGMNVLHEYMKKLDKLIPACASKRPVCHAQHGTGRNGAAGRWANLACLCVSARRQEEIGYGG